MEDIKVKQRKNWRRVRERLNSSRNTWSKRRPRQVVEEEGEEYMKPEDEL